MTQSHPVALRTADLRTANSRGHAGLFDGLRSTLMGIGLCVVCGCAGVPVEPPHAATAPVLNLPPPTARWPRGETIKPAAENSSRTLRQPAGAVVRSQNPSEPNGGYWRNPMPASGPRDVLSTQNQWAPYDVASPSDLWYRNNSAPASPIASRGAAAPWQPQASGIPSASRISPTVPFQNPRSNPVQPVQWGQPSPVAAPPPAAGPIWGQPAAPAIQAAPTWGPPLAGGAALTTPPPLVASPAGSPAYASPLLPPGGMGVPTPLTDIIVNVQEAQTGKLSFGAAVNSDAGLTGQIVLEEKNFDWRRVPATWDDWINGTAFRGAGQGLRIEALPGSQVQRYSLQFTEPYFLDTYWSFNVSAFLFDRAYFDWNEQRLGGRLGFGYRITPDLSLQVGMRLEEITISDIRFPGASPKLDSELGSHELYSGRVSLIQDTRDIPFAPTQGYYLELGFEQVFGSFDYPRGNIDFRRYFLVTERPDGSGRHVLGFSNKIFLSDTQTPIFENYFAGGFSTMRGFEFRGASPKEGGVTVGGRLMTLGSVEYRFPITADDMLQGVVFCDYGTVEEELEIDWDDYRVALGGGLRIAVPALSAAPIALDFSVPIAREDTDSTQLFAFWVGVSR